MVMRLNHLRGKGKAEDGASVFFFPLDVQLLVTKGKFRGCIWEFLMSFGSARLRFRFICKTCYLEAFLLYALVRCFSRSDSKLARASFAERLINSNPLT